jgi:hypothetical protein
MAYSSHLISERPDQVSGLPDSVCAYQVPEWLAVALAKAEGVMVCNQVYYLVLNYILQCTITYHEAFGLFF